MVNIQEHIKCQATDLLKKYWGYEYFRPDQLEVITNILLKKDAIVLFPTGGGKSLTFQIPALILPHVTLVISPLIALMDDQVSDLKSRGIKAEALHSGKSYSHVERILDNCRWGNLKLLYISPERVANERFQAQLLSISVSMVAIDEAHCISQWGHDFRPSYLKIGEMCQYWPDVIKMALTATATPRVIKDIELFGNLVKPQIFKKSSKRGNISLNVHLTERKIDHLKKLIKSFEKVSAIVYVRNRRAVRQLADLLANEGYVTAHYHAGLSFAQRQETQKKYMNGSLDIMCATNAFGMGLDKSDVRQVIHFDIPPSIEEYVQEFGRAGRDGAFAEAHMIVNEEDKKFSIKKNKDKFPSFDLCRSIYIGLFNFFKIPLESGEGQVRSFDIIDFSKKINLTVAQVYHGIQVLKKNEYISTFDQRHKQSTAKIVVQIKELRKNELSLSENLILSALVRIYEGILEYKVVIEVKQISQFCDLTLDDTLQILNKLKSQKWIDFYLETEGERILFLHNRLPKSHFHINIKRQNELKYNGSQMLQSILDYVALSTCRSVNITQYFGENKEVRCNICDNCKRENKAQNKTIDDSQNQLEEGMK
ncbi:MAG: RecQ family ATP-dependent DNA helicase [Saprospiraceae bacterium]